jgi:pimeloyl-ACP methyl ester carboxylesterase
MRTVSNSRLAIIEVASRDLGFRLAHEAARPTRGVKVHVMKLTLDPGARERALRAATNLSAVNASGTGSTQASTPDLTIALRPVLTAFTDYEHRFMIERCADVSGREDLYFGYEFNIQTEKKLPADVVDYYVGLLRDPDSLHGTFAFYREWDTMMAQNEQRGKRPLTMPVLGIGGAASHGADVANAMKLVANDVQSAVIPGAGHFFAEEAPEETLAALAPFLAPYRDKAAAR